MTRYRKQATPEQMAKAEAKRAKLRELAQAIGDMNDAQRQAMAARARIRTIEGHELSPANQCLVLMQCDAATVVGGFRQWKKAGRSVRKGESALGIWTPSGRGGAGEQPPAAAGEDTDNRPRFIFGNVFDITQTDPMEGDTPEALYQRAGDVLRSGERRRHADAVAAYAREALERARGAAITAALAQWEKDGKQDCGACGGAMTEFDARTKAAREAETMGLTYRSGRELWLSLPLPDGIASQHEAIPQAMHKAFREALEFEGFGNAIKRHWKYVD